MVAIGAQPRVDPVLERPGPSATSIVCATSHGELAFRRPFTASRSASPNNATSKRPSSGLHYPSMKAVGTLMSSGASAAHLM